MKRILLIIITFIPVLLFAQPGGKTEMTIDTISVRDGIKIKGVLIDSVSTDTSFSDVSDDKIPTTKAVKSYVDMNGGGASFNPGKGLIDSNGTASVNFDTVQVKRLVSTLSDLDSINGKADTRYYIEDSGAEYLEKADSLQGVQVDGTLVRKTKSGFAFIQSKQGYMNPKWVGATGDSITSDLEVIQDLVNYSRADLIIDQKYNLGGDTLFLQEGQTIRFSNGGMLVDGYISGNQSYHVSGITQTYSNVNILGSWNTEKSYVEFFVPNLTNSISNFQALQNAILYGKGVELLEKDYPLSTTDVFTSGHIERSVNISGVDRSLSRIVLETNHDNSGLEGRGYFAASNDINRSGNNAEFKNLTITTSNYENGSLNAPNVYYILTCQVSTNQDSITPDIDYIRFIDADIFGEVRIKISSDGSTQELDEFISKGVKEIFVDNCFTDRVSSLFNISAVPFKSAIIQNNIIKNIRGAWFFAPVNASLPDEYEQPAYDARKKFDFISNDVSNDSIFEPITAAAYMSAVVIKGFNAKILNNTFSNLITTDDDTETYSFYCSVSNDLQISGNKQLNVFGRNNGFISPLVKFKGARKVNMFDNKFELEKQVYVDVGILNNINQSFFDVNKSLIQASLIDVDDTPDTSSTISEWYIKDNYFRMPLLNMYTDAHDARDFVFTNNVIDIDFVGDKDAGNWGGVATGVGSSLWNFRNERDGLENKPGNWISHSNIINVDSVETGRFRYTYGAGLRTLSDTIKNYKLYKVSDIFNVNNSMVSVSALDATTMDVSSRVNGKNSDFIIDYGTTSIATVPEVDKLIQNTFVSDFKNYGQEEGIFEIAPYVSAKHFISTSQSDSITLFEGNLNTWNNNISDERPLKVSIDIKYQDSVGIYYKQNYKLIFTSNGRRWNFYTNDAPLLTDPASGSANDYLLQGSGTGDVDLALHTFSNRFHYVTLRNTANLKNIEINFNIDSFYSSVQANWDSYVTPGETIPIYGNTLIDNRIQFGGLLIIRGTGSPEGVVTASVGSFYLREDGGVSTTMYVKETGTGNTGWVAK